MDGVALIVGASSNLGYQVLRKAIDVLETKIYFTTDDETAGYNILKNLKKDNVEYIKMDITYTKTIINLRHHIQDLDERIDLIINVSDYVPGKHLSNIQKVRNTLGVYFYGFINFGKLLYPLLNENARVINVSGAAGLLATVENEKIRKRIGDLNLTEDELVMVMQDYEEAVRRGIERTEGWGPSVDAVAKVALNAVTFLQHREWRYRGVIINCVNPGAVNSREGRKTAKMFEEGAKVVLYAALEAPSTINGSFIWSNFSVIDWNCDPFVEVTTV